MATYDQKVVEQAHELSLEELEDSKYPDSASSAVRTVVDNQLKLAAKLDAILDVMIGSV